MGEDVYHKFLSLNIWDKYDGEINEMSHTGYNRMTKKEKDIQGYLGSQSTYQAQR